jgi:hypothetical protein
MIDKLPHIKRFTRSYWNEPADLTYGTIENALLQYLEDAKGLPDGGRVFRDELRQELLLILNNAEYEQWVKNSFNNIDVIRSVGGRFVMPRYVESLLAILEGKIGRDLH